MSLPKKEDLVVNTIPQQPGGLDDLQQYAGQLPLSKTDMMFFWLIANQTNTQNKGKLVIWLNGGPGCSSLDGVFMENGPYRFNEGKLEKRPYSLQTQFDVLYIDQPLGTGFSQAPDTDLAKTFAQATETLVGFLDKFYQVFPELQSRHLYLAGESEAGTYIPYLAEALLKQNKRKIGGLMIGNGWIDPLPMYLSYVEILRDHPQLLDSQTEQQMREAMAQCTRAYQRGPQSVHKQTCEGIPGVFLQGSSGLDRCSNMYDLRLTDSYPSCGMNWPPEVHQYTEYLNRRDVQHALNIPKDRAPTRWQECNPKTSKALKGEDSEPAVGALERVMERGVEVLLFSGKEDFLCNYVGTEWMIGNMTWKGQKGFVDSRALDWTVEGEAVGQVRRERGLMYAKVYGASHMVGVDRPREVLDMFTAFANASDRNLRFGSSLRPTTDKPQHGWSIVVGLGLAALLLMGLALCLWKQQMLCGWWEKLKNSKKADSYRQINEEEDETDETFAMSEFTFNNPAVEYPEGFLLDDGTASSPDEETEDITK